MPVLPLLRQLLPSTPAPTPAPTPAKPWEELAPLIAAASTTVALPSIAFTPGSVRAEVVTELLPEPVPFLEKASAFVLCVLGEAKDPPIRAVALRLSEGEGIAVTSGGVVTLFLPYFAQHRRTHSADEAARELLGVLLHELVHVYQHDGRGGMPGGVIEGVADFVRLRGGLGAPHWCRRRGGVWDAGYERTGYFLDWVEGRWPGFVRVLNGESRTGWDAAVFRVVTGQAVDALWERYQAELPEVEVGGGAAPARPTEAG
ncbi:BSP-domain-containing protein [Calocera cornea HHB12733]|uniref:BSP-domain-containing protein n=1 Tax=Calocera cornea HHB12733 TaxID=1353952 RepID=A0A165E1S8_9BASI|nr:BSP-domain-containing protein [Calocera cornea HHB12733]